MEGIKHLPFVPANDRFLIGLEFDDHLLYTVIFTFDFVKIACMYKTSQKLVCYILDIQLFVWCLYLIKCGGTVCINCLIQFRGKSVIFSMRLDMFFFIAPIFLNNQSCIQPSGVINQLQTNVLLMFCLDKIIAATSAKEQLSKQKETTFLAIIALYHVSLF